MYYFAAGVWRAGRLRAARHEHRHEGTELGSVPVWVCCLVLMAHSCDRPAGTALLDNQTDVVGIPAFLPMDPGSTAGFYFVTAREAARATSNGAQSGSGAGQACAGSGATTDSDAKSGGGSRGSRAGRPLPLGVLPFEGLQLGPPLGAQQPQIKLAPST